MKIKNSIGLLLVVLSMSMNSCYDTKMEWEDPYTHPEARELPLQLQEAISRYNALKTYTNFKLGVGIDFGLYLSNANYRNIVNANFTEITPGNEMKHRFVVNSRGELDFTQIDNAIAELKSNGLSIYGHTLAWSQNQNATYLNGLIAPTIIPGTPGSSLIVNGDFENGLEGWNIPYYSENVSAVTDEAIDGTHSMKVVVGDFGGGKYNMQINSPTFPIIEGHKYEISFFIKSEGEGSIGLDFPNNNLTNQYPWTAGKELAPTSPTWTKVTYSPTTTPDGMVATANNQEMRFRLLLGAVADMTYYIDGVEVIDLDAAAEFNYVTDGDFEKGELPEGWRIANSGAGTEVTDEDKFTGNYSIKMISSATSAQAWNLQLESATISLDPDKTYTFSFYVKSDVPGKGRVSFPGGIDGNQYPWMNWTGSGAGEAFTTPAGAWTLISVDLTKAADIKLSFDMGYYPDVTYFIDDIKIVEKKEEASQSIMRAGPVIIEKTPEEKAEIIGAAFESWISQMVSHCKSNVQAWDVVNEPMSDAKPSSLKSASEKSELAADEFFWQDYLGKDYGVMAFKLARQYGNGASDKLFINDYNLESNPAKLQGLIDYTNYIESQGAKVDGIGTQMHIGLTTDTLLIDQMFQALAATGKLIKITELDVRMGTASPTAEQYATQANMYRYVVASFTKYVPEAQRYGITVWGVSDNEEEHVYWLPDESPCLWDAGYERKHAYKGFADGLAGRDVSADFSGELEY